MTRQIVWAHRQPRHLLAVRLDQGYSLRYQDHKIAVSDLVRFRALYPNLKYRFTPGRGWVRGTWIIRQVVVR